MGGGVLVLVPTIRLEELFFLHKCYENFGEKGGQVTISIMFEEVFIKSCLKLGYLGNLGKTKSYGTHEVL